MPITYGSKSNGDMQPFKTVMVTQVDLPNLRCEVQEVSGPNKFLVSLRTAVGHFYHLPDFGEEWIVTRVNGLWSFYRKTSTQNPAIVALATAEPGDIILGAQNNIKVISPMIQDPITNTWKATGNSIPSGVVTQIAPPIPVVPDKIATLVGAQLKMLYTGTFAIHFMTQSPLLNPGRALAEIFAGPYWRRGLFHDEDICDIETTVALNKDDIVRFNVYQTTGSPVLFTHTIDITQVR